MAVLKDLVPAGVITGDDVQTVLAHAKANQFALPAVNVVGSNSINAVMETARDVNSPVIIQFSSGGAVFNAGKGLSNEGQQAAIAGAVAGADRAVDLRHRFRGGQPADGDRPAARAPRRTLERPGRERLGVVRLETAPDGDRPAGPVGTRAAGHREQAGNAE